MIDEVWAKTLRTKIDDEKMHESFFIVEVPTDKFKEAVGELVRAQPMGSTWVFCYDQPSGYVVLPQEAVPASPSCHLIEFLYVVMKMSKKESPHLDRADVARLYPRTSITVGVPALILAWVDSQEKADHMDVADDDDDIVWNAPVI